MLWCFRLFGLSGCRSLGVGRLDGIDWDDGILEQLADARDIFGSGLAGEESVVTDAVETRWQNMHQEAADELVRMERHRLVVSLWAIKPVILPLEGDAFVVEGDQAAVGDGDAVGVAREVTQDFLWATKWAFAINHPFAVTQRRQIGRKGSCVRERSMLAEELQLSGLVSIGELLQDQPAEQS